MKNYPRFTAFVIMLTTMFLFYLITSIFVYCFLVDSTLKEITSSEGHFLGLFLIYWMPGLLIITDKTDRIVQN